MPRKYPSLQARLDANVELVSDPAWEKPHKLWTGALKNNGYGKLNVRVRHREKYGPRKGHRKIKTVAAHRLALALHLGVPVWKLNHVAHLCDLKRCIEPTHLKSTTQRWNILDCVAKGRHRNGATGKLNAGC